MREASWFRGALLSVLFFVLLIGGTPAWASSPDNSNHLDCTESGNCDQDDQQDEAPVLGPGSDFCEAAERTHKAAKVVVVGAFIGAPLCPHCFVFGLAGAAGVKAAALVLDTVGNC